MKMCPSYGKNYGFECIYPYHTKLLLMNGFMNQGIYTDHVIRVPLWPSIQLQIHHFHRYSDNWLHLGAIYLLFQA